MVADRLRDDPIVQKRDIDVDTREGVVFLTGTVESVSERSIAIRLARETPGVRDVEANLRIGEG
jgi:osmotically-inducible protein OsmY